MRKDAHICAWIFTPAHSHSLYVKHFKKRRRNARSLANTGCCLINERRIFARIIFYREVIGD